MRGGGDSGRSARAIGDSDSARIRSVEMFASRMNEECGVTPTELNNDKRAASAV